MARETAAQLRERIEKLEAENAALKTTTESPKPRRRSAGWTVLATVLIVIGALLAPVAVIGSWVSLTLTDTDRFVATYAPLADDPEVQEFVAAQASAAITEKLDVPGLTSSVIDGIIDLGVGRVAARALESLKGPATSGIETLIQSQVTGFVASDAFSTVWTEALRVSHTQLLAALQSQPGSLVSLSDDGEIGIQLSPIIAAIKTHLVEQGLTIASAIPAIDRTIVIAQSDAVPTVRVAYLVGASLGTWLPLVALAFLIAGVLVARRRTVALIWAAIALAISMGLALAGIGAGSVLFIASVTPILPVGVAGTLFDTVASAMRTSAIAVLVLALVVAIVAWLAGPFETPRKLRALAQSGAANIRGAAESRGLSTGRAGEWMYRQRILLRVIVAVVAAVVIFFARPLTAGVIGWTLLVSVIVVVLLELLQRPVDTPVEDADATAA